MLNPALRRERVTRKLFATATLALACVLVPVAALRAPAQNAGGKISGTVYDASGGVVAKARVMLRNLDGRNTELTNTNPAGLYEFGSVPAGRYRLEVAAPGFKKYQQDGVVVGGAPAMQNVVLEVGQVSETIDVVGNSPSAKPTAVAPGRLKMGGQVQATKLVHMVRPEYPPQMKAQGVEGTVLMRAVIGREGQVLNLEVMNTDVHPDLVQSAKEAVSQWRYQPTLLNGEPVEIITEITVNYTLAK
jgi:TonB family protein